MKRFLMCAAMLVCLAFPAAADMNADLNRLINQVRMKMGREPVNPSSKLAKAARIHAKDMYNNRQYSIIGSDGSHVGDRLRRTGYNYCFAVQFYAIDQSGLSSGHASRSLHEVFNDWVNNDDSSEFLGDRRVKEFGVSEYNGIWSMVLAQPHSGTGGC